jgi:hypothetical protein
VGFEVACPLDEDDEEEEEEEFASGDSVGDLSKALSGQRKAASSMEAKERWVRAAVCVVGVCTCTRMVGGLRVLIWFEPEWHGQLDGRLMNAACQGCTCGC